MNSISAGDVRARLESGIPAGEADELADRIRGRIGTTMADSLWFAGYDHTFVSGRGFHSLAHGRPIFPDSLRWLWRR